MEPDRTAKVVVIGDMGVGKTSLLIRFTDNKFYSSPIVTIGTDFKRRTLEVDDRKLIIEVWDTAGQERYKSLTSRFFRKANGVILVFDVTKMQSFYGIQNWLNELDQHEINRSRCLLVGNKIDMTNERVVDNSQAKELANRHELLYSETSAKDGKNVQQTFAMLAKEMLAQIKHTESVTARESLEISLKWKPHNKETKKRKRSNCVCQS